MLTIKNLNKTYSTKRNNFVIFDNFSYQFNNTGLYFIVGKSGCGKSTLLNMIATLIKPDKGSIKLNNIEYSNLSENDSEDFRNEHIGIVFQNFNLLETNTVLENLEIPLNLNSTINKETIDFKKILEKVDLQINLNQKVSTLSGGEKQRVAIARALIKNPTLLLCDEPTGSIDKENSKVVYNILKEISKEKLVIVCSHDLSGAKEYADEIIDLTKKKKINSIELIDESNQNFSDISFSKHGINFKERLRLIKNFLFNQKIRVSIVALLSLLTGTSLNFVPGMIDNKNIILKYMKENNINYFNVQKTVFDGSNMYDEYPYSMNRKSMNLNDKDINYIAGKTGLTTYQCVYDCFNSKLYELKLKDEYLDNNLMEFNFNGTLEISEDCINKYKLSYKGALPSNDDEVMISTYASFVIENNKFYDYSTEQYIEISNDEQLIGQTIRLNNDSTLEKKIVGIIDTNFIFQEESLYYFSYANDNYMKANLYYFMQSGLHSLLFVNKGYPKKIVDTSGIDITKNPYKKVLFDFGNKTNCYKFLEITNKPTKNIYDVSNILNCVGSLMMYEFENEITIAYNNHDSSIEAFDFILIGLLALFIISIMCLGISLFISLVDQNKRNISIYKIFGCHNNQLLFTLCLSPLLIIVPTIILSTIVSYIINAIVKSILYMNYYSISVLYVSPLMGIITIILLGLPLVLTVLIAMKKLLKSNTISIINRDL